MADFKKIKDTISIDQVAQMLNLPVKKEPTSLRCQCPVHGGDNRSLAITVAKGVFYCMQDKKGGSCIDLVAHVRQIGEKEAAEAIAKHFALDSSSTAPQPRQEAASAGLRPLDYLDPLADEVVALGIQPHTADLIGIGFANKGTMSGRVLFPIRLPDGTLVAYCGISLDKDPPFLFPENLEERAEGKIVQLRRKT